MDRIEELADKAEITEVMLRYEPVPRYAMTNFVIELDSDRARSRNYMASGTGLYTVEHVRTPEGWRAQRFEMRNYARPAG